MTEEATRRNAWMRRWGLLGLICLILVALTTGCGWWWYVSEGDLNAFKQRARASGVALTWKDAGVVRSDAARLAIWDQIVALIDDKAVGGYLRSGKEPMKYRKLFTPIPDELRAHHAAIDPVRLTRLLDLTDRLGTEPLILYTEQAFPGQTPEFTPYRSLACLLRERVWLAEEREVPRECRRLLGFCATFSPSSMQVVILRSSLVDFALSAVVDRLAVLRERDPGIADLVDRLADRTLELMAQAAAKELLIELSLVELPFATSDWLGNAVTGRLFLRAGRSEMLERQLDWLLHLRARPDARTLLSHCRSIFVRPVFQWDPRYRLAWITQPYVEVTTLTELRSQLHAQVVAAELRGSPWPKDSFDPDSKPLRRFEQNGRLVGAYSVDTDGTDNDGAELKDSFFPLYGPREAPKTSP